MMTAHVISAANEAKKYGLTAENMPIQDLMIYLTESEVEV